MNYPKPSLDEMLARVPRDVPPSRNLWTDIALEDDRCKRSPMAGLPPLSQTKANRKQR